MNPLLIESKQQLIAIIPVASSIDFDAIKPEIQDSIDFLLATEIGVPLCAAIYAHRADTEEPWKTAYTLACKAVANDAIAKYIPKLAVNINGSGVTRTESANEKSAYRYQEENVIQSYLRTADNAIELLLKHCESDPTTLSWNGAEYTYLKSNHLPTAEAFNQFIDIGNSRRVFRKLKPYLEVIQNDKILSNIGAELNTKILHPDADGLYLTVRYYVKQALANLVMAEALPILNVTIADNGATVISSAASGDNAPRNSTVSQDQISSLILKFRTDGEVKIKQLVSFLMKNAQAITEYSGNAEVYNPEFTPFKNDPDQGGGKIF